MHKAILLIFCALLLSGCEFVGMARTAVAERGADAADQTLDTALWTICNGSPVGAINRRFRSADERAAYREICPSNLLPEGGQVESLPTDLN